MKNKTKALTSVTSALVITSALAFSPTANAEELITSDVVDSVVATTAQTTNFTDNSDDTVVDDSDVAKATEDTTVLESETTAKVKSVADGEPLYFGDDYMSSKFLQISDNLKITSTGTLTDATNKVVINLMVLEDVAEESNAYTMKVDTPENATVQVKFGSGDYKELDTNEVLRFDKTNYKVAVKVTNPDKSTLDYEFYVYLADTDGSDGLDDGDLGTDDGLTDGSDIDDGSGTGTDDTDIDDGSDDGSDDNTNDNPDDSQVDIGDGGVTGTPADDDDGTGDDSNFDDTYTPSTDDGTGTDNSDNYPDTTDDGTGSDNSDGTGTDDSTFDDSSIDDSSGVDELPQTGYNESNAVPISGTIALLLSIVTFGIYRKKNNC